MSRLKYYAFASVFITVLATLLSSAGVAQAASLTCGVWSIVTSPNAGTAADYLNGVAAVSAGDVWTVGYSYNGTLIEQWNGTQWNVVNSPNVGTNFNTLNAVAAISANDVWAVGSYYNTHQINQTLIEHWNGTQWQIVPSPNVGTNHNYLNGVAAVSSNDVWAVGNSFSTTGIHQTLIEHWNGTQWQVVLSPNAGTSDNYLNGVAVVSAGNVWAVGNSLSITGIHQTLIEQWNGITWNIVNSPNVGPYDNYLNGVAVVASNNIWAVGYSNNRSSANRTLIEQWNSTQWNVVSSPSVGPYDNYLNGVAVVSPSSIWAVGSFYNTASFSRQALIEHWNGSKWNAAKSPTIQASDNVLNGVAVAPSGGIWGAGIYYNSLIGYQTLTEFHC